MPRRRATDEPWKLWGGSEEIRAVSPGAGVAANQFTKQLCKVGYGRPDTWHWWFGARLLEGPTMPAVGNTASVRVRIDLILGEGRSMFVAGEDGIAQSFELFGWDWLGGPTDAPTNQPLYSTEVLGPNRIFGGAAVENRITQITAEAIQVRARVSFTTSIGGNQVVRVAVSGFFAPKHHARPDWFEDKFVDGEIGAR